MKEMKEIQVQGLSNLEVIIVRLSNINSTTEHHTKRMIDDCIQIQKEVV